MGRKERGERRERTRQLAQRRRKLFVELGFDGDDTLAWPAGYYSKNRPWGCACCKRRKGAPRRDVGMCDAGNRDRIYRWRIQVRELNHLLDRGWDPDDDQVALLA